MSVKISEIAECMERLAPSELAEVWDNVGLLVGGNDWCTKRVLVALDASDEVISEALEIGANCIVTHHPVIFSKLRQITETTPLGKKLIKLIKNNIAVYAAHTNLDVVVGGTADVLAELLEIKETEFLCGSAEDKYALGRLGDFRTAIRLDELAKEVKERLHLKAISYTGDSGRIVKKIGILPGSGDNYEYIETAVRKNCDVLITGDIKYHRAQEALEMGLSLIDITHYAGEVPIVDKLCDYLRTEIKGLEVVASRIDGQLSKYI